MSKILENIKTSDVWYCLLLRFLYYRFLLWKWLPLLVSLAISITSFIVTQFMILDGNTNQWVRVVNELSIAFVAGGGFSFFIRFFQYAGVFKDELKKIILDEDLHLEKSRSERDNFFINNLHIYSRFFLFKSFQKFVKRFFPEDFGTLFGSDYANDITSRISNGLVIGRFNNYVQKNVTIRFKISAYDDKNITLIQEFSSTLHKIKGSINIDKSFVNWTHQKTKIKKEQLIDIQEFKLDNIEYKEKFVYLSDDGEKDEIHGHQKTSKGIKINIKDNDKIKLESKIKFVLSSETFLYWNYKFGAYTKGVDLSVDYDSESFSANVIEFAQEEKLKGIHEAFLYKHNQDTIYMPHDSFMLVIHRKK